MGSENLTAMIPSGSFCEVKASYNQRASLATQEARATHIIERAVGHLAQRLALFPHVLLEVQQQRRIIVQLRQREHAREDDCSCVLGQRSFGCFGRTGVLVVRGPVCELPAGCMRSSQLASQSLRLQLQPALTH